MIAPCPYCTTHVDDGAVVACPICHAAHHADCWADNQGCAVTLCAAGPSASDPALRPPVPPRRTLVVDLSEAAPAAPEPPPGADLPRPLNQRQDALLTAIILVLAGTLVVVAVLLVAFATGA